MKNLVILSGAVVTGIILAAAVILHSQSGADDLFESNIRALSSENPDDVRIPCRAEESSTCTFKTIDADGVKRNASIKDMRNEDGSGN